MLTVSVFNNPASASQALAEHITRAIENRLAKESKAALVVSGGSTPLDCYQQLARIALPWQRVYVLPSDERCVPLGHAESNETMIRQTLLTQQAANANLVSIYDGRATAKDACVSLGQKLENLPLPFATVLLGMGADGHFASLFGGQTALQQGLDPDGQECCLMVETAASPYPRISLTLSTLLRSKEILLLFFGAAKRQVFEAAKKGDQRYPVSQLVDQQRTPVHVFWAPLPDEESHQNES